MIASHLPPATAAGLRKASVLEASRHLFVCIGPECCAPAAGEALWEFIKTRIKETGLKAMRTKAACLRVCTGGPWLLVYPEGLWYGAVTPDRFEIILAQHLLGGTPVADWVLARNPLAPCPSVAGDRLDGAALPSCQARESNASVEKDADSGLSGSPFGG